MWSKIKNFFQLSFFRWLRQLFFSKLFFRNIGLIILINLVVVYFALIYLEYNTKHGEKIEVPNLVGKPIDEAKELLAELNLGYEILDSIYCPCCEPGTVLEQLIEPTYETIEFKCCPNDSIKQVFPSGVHVKSGRTIQLRLSKNTEFIEVPNLENKQYEFAKDVLKRRGLCSKVVYEPDRERSGAVIKQSYKGAIIEPNRKIPIGDTITLHVGKTRIEETVETPNLVGKYLEPAIRELEYKNFKNYYVICKGCQTQADSLNNPIVKQNPEFYNGSRVPKGTTFTLTIGPIISEDENVE